VRIHLGGEPDGLLDPSKDPYRSQYAQESTGLSMASIYLVNRTVNVFDTIPGHHCIPTPCSLCRHLGHLLSWSSFIVVVSCWVDCEQQIPQEIKRNARRNEGEMKYWNAQQMTQPRRMQGMTRPLTDNASILNTQRKTQLF
jgi:hypothetical protein